MGGRGTGSGLKKRVCLNLFLYLERQGLINKKIRTRFVGFNEEYSSS